MNAPRPTTPLDSGIAVIHSNQLEQLREVLAYWLQTYPLAPLENEVVLVQSNGMGQWLKQGLAHNAALGIAAAMTIQLPSLFIWSAYRAVLGAQIPKEQPLAKAPLLWRLYRMLPSLTAQTDFATLSHFLADDKNSRKRYQLAEQLADLFDQYQVYRADWLADWLAGQNGLRNAHGELKALADKQQWQPALWRAVLADLAAELLPFASRAAVHGQFLAHMDKLTTRPAGLPRRIILFGLSALPQQALEVFAKLGKFCQIILFVHNPCQHYWADIIEDKELLKAERRRHNYKAGMGHALDTGQLHLYAPPLLAAWGKQGRDYIRLLDQFDNTEAYANWHWPEQKIDVFADYGEAGQRSLLQNVQQAILDLEPLPSQPDVWHTLDESLVFHIAHSSQREVEILHDQLLARFETAQQHGQPLYPRDVLVMVPDINQYAPAIRAVFDLIPPDDPRHIPYSLSDQQQRGQNPLLVAVEALLNLPEARFTVSELLDLLRVPAIREHFKLKEEAISKLHHWIEQAGIRWGLNAGQRSQTVAMPAHLDANTWLFGLRRMLLGYAVGAGEAFNGIAPYEEIGGLDAQWLGGLCFLLDTLAHYNTVLKEEHPPLVWQALLSKLLDDFFSASDERELKTLDTLKSCLASWQHHCGLAGLGDNDLLPINVVREAWLNEVDEPALHRRFLSGRVNFCTLMPMRAIPFRVICLLGMNDGDYPRNHPSPSFDLMGQSGQYRPGDRSRRQDDQYLFLEALLSAREQLYISWVGRSIRDNSERPPSVLVSQLRDVLAQSWMLPENKPKLLEALTLVHPLQAFSLAYVAHKRDTRLFTYAREWFANTPAEASASAALTAPTEQTITVSMDTLARFLKSPVKTFCQYTLKLAFEEENLTSEDCEPFAFDRLQTHIYSQQLLDRLKSEHPDNIEAFFSQQQTTLARQGQLPLGGFANMAYRSIAEPVRQAWQRFQTQQALWPIELESRALQLDPFELKQGIAVQLTGNLSQLCTNGSGQTAMLQLTAQALLSKDKKIKHHNVLGYWVRHVAACADGVPLQTLIVAADSVLTIPPIEPAEAYLLFYDLVDAYHLGLQTPLPLACKTAFTWLAAPPDKALEKAQGTYEGTEWNNGEMAYDAYLLRFFPSFAELNPATTKENFTFWADRLYRPPFKHIQQLSTDKKATQ